MVHRQSLRTVFARAKSAYLRAGVQWQKEWQHGWRVQAGADLAGGKNLTADFFVQQAYMDVAWKAIKMSIGSKERNGFPLEKDVRLSSGMMVKVRMQDLFRR